MLRTQEIECAAKWKQKARVLLGQGALLYEVCGLHLRNRFVLELMFAAGGVEGRKKYGWSGGQVISL